MQGREEDRAARPAARGTAARAAAPCTRVASLLAASARPARKGPGAAQRPLIRSSARQVALVHPTARHANHTVVGVGVCAPFAIGMPLSWAAAQA